LVFSEAARLVGKEAVTLLKKRGLEAKGYPLESVFEDWPRGLVGVPRGAFDVVVIMGGDGAVLKTLSALWPVNLPFLAINFGKRGYLSEVEHPAWRSALEHVARGEFTVERAMRVEARIENETSKPGLNEVLITRERPYKLVRLTVSLEGYREPLFSVESDGMIISTPIGSTGHSLSAGGPIVDRRIRALVINVLNPLVPVPKFVLAAERALLVETACKQAASLEIVVDGMPWKRVKCGTALVVRAAKEDALFIRLPTGRGARRALRVPWLSESAF
jgi:NAD+ kinase